MSCYPSCHVDPDSPTGWSRDGFPYTPGGSCDYHKVGECPACDAHHEVFPPGYVAIRVPPRKGDPTT